MTSKFVVLLATDILNVRIACITQLKLARAAQLLESSDPLMTSEGHVIRKHDSEFFCGRGELGLEIMIFHS